MLKVKENKIDDLISLLVQEKNISRTLVFVRLKQKTDAIAIYLSNKGIQATSIHGYYSFF